MKPHRTDRVSLVAGLAFLAAAGLWLTAWLVPLHVAAVGAIAAAGLLVLGGLGVAHAISSGRRSR